MPDDAALRQEIEEKKAALLEKRKAIEAELAEYQGDVDAQEKFINKKRRIKKKGKAGAKKMDPKLKAKLEKKEGEEDDQEEDGELGEEQAEAE